MAQLLEDKIDLSYKQIQEKYVYINYVYAFRQVTIARQLILNSVKK